MRKLGSTVWQRPVDVYADKPVITVGERQVVMTIAWVSSMYGPSMYGIGKPGKPMYIRAELILTSGALMGVTTGHQLQLVGKLSLADNNTGRNSVYLAACKLQTRHEVDLHDLLNGNADAVSVDYSIAARAANNDIENAIAVAEFAQILPLTEKALTKPWKQLLAVHTLTTGQ